MSRLLAEGEVALARTPELLAVLKEAGVVDAGGKGFVRMIEGVVRLIEGDPILPATATMANLIHSRSRVRCRRGAGLPVLHRGDGPGRTASVGQRGTLRPAQFGGSVQVVVVGDILKLHVHTDTPDAVFTCAARWGTVSATKAEDMRVQHRKLAHPERRPVAIVADSSSDLPDAVLDRHHIALVPLQVMFGDTSYRVRVELKPEAFYATCGARERTRPPRSRHRPSSCGSCVMLGRRPTK